MQTVDEIARDIVRREGGFVNDPADPGGATNLGVTIGTLRQLGLDIDRDGDVDVADLRALTVDDAVRIYTRHYFERPGIAALPACLHATVFDMQVNAGSNAGRILQEVLNEAGFGPLKLDGAIGAMTAAAAARAEKAMGPTLLADAYGIARRSYYYRLADQRAPLRKFARRRDGGKGGWITRAEEFISPRFHLTDRQHRERVAAWG